MKFWAVFGIRGCREKNLPTAISMQLFRVVFFNFLWAKGKFKQILISIHTKKLHNIKLSII